MELSEAVVWHELECGAYEADLPLWRELARAAGGRVLEIGAGAGRVTLELARLGHQMTALERDPELLEKLHERAAAMGLRGIETVCADARELAAPPASFALCIVPMQTLQLLGGVRERRAFLARAYASLRPGGVLACAIVTEVHTFDARAGGVGAEPDLVRAGDLAFVSRAVRVAADAGTIRIERERRVLEGWSAGAARSALATGSSGRAQAPPGRSLEHDVVELARVQVAELQREGEDVGLIPRGTRAIAPSERHSGSVVVMFGA